MRFAGDFVRLRLLGGLRIRPVRDGRGGGELHPPHAGKRRGTIHYPGVESRSPHAFAFVSSFAPVDIRH
jgi:hypothetical protein